MSFYSRDERALLEDFDLMQAVRQGAQYPRRQILDVSGALFRQLLDGEPLVANRAHRMKLTFTYREFPGWDSLLPPRELFAQLAGNGESGLTYDSARGALTHWQGPSMNPERTQNPALPTATKTGSLSQWLRHTAAIIDGDRFDVAQTIRAARHLLGGGHHGVPKDAFQDKLVEFQESLELLAPTIDEQNLFGQHYLPNGPIRQIVFIAGVTAAGIEPLVEKIRG